MSEPASGLHLHLSAEDLRAAGLTEPAALARTQLIAQRLMRHLLAHLSADQDFQQGRPPRPLIADLSGCATWNDILGAACDQIGAPDDVIAAILREEAQARSPEQLPSTAGTTPWTLAVEGDGPGSWPPGLTQELLRLIATLNDPEALADRLPREVRGVAVTYVEPGEHLPEHHFGIPGDPAQLRRMLQQLQGTP